MRWPMNRKPTSSSMSRFVSTNPYERANHRANDPLMAVTVAGPAIILLNKHILGSLKFPFPYLLTCMGLMCASVASTVLVKLK